MKQFNQRISEALDSMIEKTSKGDGPTDALIAVAGELGMGPGMVNTLAAFYNKAQGAAVLRKAASDEARRSFPLADAGEAVKVMMAKMVPGLAEDKKCELPPRRRRGGADKEASDDGFAEDLREEREWARRTVRAGEGPVYAQFRRLEGIWKKASQKLRAAECAARENMKSNLNDLGAMARRMSEKTLEKSARMVVNHYRRYGRSMMTAVLADADRELPAPIEKTATAGVLPREPFFEKMDDFFRSILDYGEASLDKRAFDAVSGGEAFVKWGRLIRGDDPAEEGSVKSSFYKLAGADGVDKTAAGGGLAALNLLLNSLEHVRSGAGRAAAGLAGIASREGHIKKDLNAELSSVMAGGPDLYRTMRQLKAKETFLILSLYDDNLSQYPMERLEKAFNEAMLMHPTAYRKPGLTKVLMLQNLESGGVVDPFVYGSMVKNEKFNEDLLSDAKENRELRSKALRTVEVKGEQTSGDALSKKLDSSLDKLEKRDRKRRRDFAKRP